MNGMHTTVTPHAKNIFYDSLLKLIIPSNVPLIDVNDLKETSDCILLDTREYEEFKISHIANAVNVGYNNFDIQVMRCFNRKKVVITYCSVGVRSAKIAKQLAAEGFENVFNLYGGIFEWVNRGNEIYNENQSTHNLHVYPKFWSVWAHGCRKIL